MAIVKGMYCNTLIVVARKPESFFSLINKKLSQKIFTEVENNYLNHEERGFVTLIKCILRKLFFNLLRWPNYWKPTIFLSLFPEGVKKECDLFPKSLHWLLLQITKAIIDLGTWRKNRQTAKTTNKRYVHKRNEPWFSHASYTCNSPYQLK